MPKVTKGKISARKSLWICEYCDKEWPSPSRLAQHQRVHTGDRPFPCNLCTYSTTEKSALQTHIRRHLQEKLFKCPEPLCNYSAVTKRDLKTHDLVHTREKPHSCPFPLCSYKTGHKCSLTGHLKTHEENRSKPFQCDLCPFTATTRQIIKTHMAHVHATKKKFKCEEEGCAYAGKTKTNLNAHVKTHQKNIIKCSHPNCEYTTNAKLNLKAHMKIHSETKRHKCRICKYATHQSSNLVRHMRIHTKESPYKCQVQDCLFESKQSGTLKRHVAIFHPAISVSAPVCS